MARCAPSRRRTRRSPSSARRTGRRCASRRRDESNKLTRDLREVKGIDVKENVAGIDEAQFVIKGGKPTIQLPKPEAFTDMHQQVSSLAHAAAHAQLYKDAEGRAVTQGRDAQRRREERQQEKAVQRAQPGQAHAGPADKPITPGGDPSVRTPPSRGGGPGGGQTQTQARGKTDKADKGQPAR